MIANIKGLVRVLKELRTVLNKRQKKQAVYVSVVLIIASGLELMGVGMVMPFISAITTPEKMGRFEVLSSLTEILGINGQKETLLIWGGALIVVYLIKNAYMIWANYCKYDYTSGLQRDLSVEMLESYLKQPYLFFSETNSAEILRGCTDDIIAVYGTMNSVFSLLLETITITVIGIYLLYTDFITAISSMLIVGLVASSIALFLKPLIKKLGIVNKEVTTNRNKIVTQTVQGIKDIKVTRRENIFLETYLETANKASKTIRDYNVIQLSPERIIEGLCVSGIIGVIVFRIFGNDGLTSSFIPKMAAFAMAAFKVLPSIGKITNAINTIVYNMPMAHNAYVNISGIRNGYSNENPVYCEETYSHNAKHIGGYADKDYVSLSNVRWKYPKQSEAILNGINIRIHEGEAVGIVGESGAGKSTVADIMLGLIRPLEGEVNVEGIEISELLKEKPGIIAYVPQNVFLLDDTIRSNVVFNPLAGNSEDIDNRVWEALEKAQIADYVHTLQDGLDTCVGEHGLRLSGGQRQRISIARALFSSPKILVMDEATSALDDETENLVMETIEGLHGKMTLVIIAHRLTTIGKCDRIYQISNGRAREVSYDQIIK